MANTEILSLATLAGGAAVERFDHELQKVIENILDINTKADAVRQVTLTLKIKPNEDRSFCVTEILVNGKVAPIRPEQSSFHISHQNGQAVATEYNPKQEKLAFIERS